ncbi:sulfite exporter TauE/SafE family protein [Paractinoplanes atraurantiacus]|uniref:Probable membrane transporter protein n=1 Tax=Paractinoplanes atraurantiacus TaxID=1036182 RepID=A0A285K5G8_9ACTN|nr:sulfite exporter TauE/SafE family protein [Actinoplanes atraurantiacus]SNY67267.1 hypothetical protein SAMN05421748_13170 [Actinoplanes atraurantiacus]
MGDAGNQVGVIALIAVLVGISIGAVGVGGVALPPALTWFARLDPHTAAGTSTFSFLLTGLAGTLAYARHKAVPWRMAGLLTCGVAPAAALGSLVNGMLPDPVVMIPLGVFATAAGLYHLLLRRRTTAGTGEMGATTTIAVGVLVGFCSALTGTGGPVFLIPVLLALRVPAVTAVAAGQVIQLPLVGFATAAYAYQGLVVYGKGTLIGVIAAAGVVLGARLALRLRQDQLQRITSAALITLGVVVLAAV